MNLKGQVQNRLRGWFPQEPHFPRASAQIEFKPLPRESWITRNRIALGLAGGILAILIGLGTMFVGLIFSDALRSYNIFQTGATNPLQIAIQNFVLGGIGVAAGILGIVGSRIGKRCGGILLIIAGVAALVIIFLPSVLMLVSGVTELGKNPLTNPSQPRKLSNIKRFENFILFPFFFVLLSLITFVSSQLFNESQDDFIFFPFFLIIPFAMYLMEKNVLRSKFSEVFFASALILIILSGVLFGLRILTSTGYLIISFTAILSFSFLYLWTEKFFKQTYSHLLQANKHKIMSASFVLAGIILLVFSLALASHVELRLGTVNHNERILSQDFYLTQQIPDTTLSINLTTHDRIAYAIFPASVQPRQPGYSSIDFLISYKPAPAEPLVSVYERSNISSHTFDGSGGWQVTQNGTYILNLHYNYNATILVNENIGRHWSTIEPVPTTVYTPLLADYMVPALAVSLALLIVGIAISINEVFKTRTQKNDYYGANPPPPPPPPELEI